MCMSGGSSGFCRYAKNTFSEASQEEHISPRRVWQVGSCVVPPMCPFGHIGGVLVGGCSQTRTRIPHGTHVRVWLEWRTAKHHQHAQMGTLVVFRWEGMSQI